MSTPTSPVEVQAVLGDWFVWRNRTGWHAVPAPHGASIDDARGLPNRIDAADGAALVELCRDRYGWYDDCDTCGVPARDCGHRQPERAREDGGAGGS